MVHTVAARLTFTRCEAVSSDLVTSLNVATSPPKPMIPCQLALIGDEPFPVTQRLAVSRQSSRSSARDSRLATELSAAVDRGKRAGSRIRMWFSRETTKSEALAAVAELQRMLERVRDFVHWCGDAEFDQSVDGGLETRPCATATMVDPAAAAVSVVTSAWVARRPPRHDLSA